MVKKIIKEECIKEKKIFCKMVIICKNYQINLFQIHQMFNNLELINKDEMDYKDQKMNKFLWIQKEVSTKVKIVKIRKIKILKIN